MNIDPGRTAQHSLQGNFGRRGSSREALCTVWSLSKSFKYLSHKVCSHCAVWGAGKDAHSTENPRQRPSRLIRSFDKTFKRAVSSPSQSTTRLSIPVPTLFIFQNRGCPCDTWYVTQPHLWYSSLDYYFSGAWKPQLLHKPNYFEPGTWCTVPCTWYNVRRTACYKKF